MRQTAYGKRFGVWSGADCREEAQEEKKKAGGDRGSAFALLRRDRQEAGNGFCLGAIFGLAACGSVFRGAVGIQLNSGWVSRSQAFTSWRSAVAKVTSSRASSMLTQPTESYSAVLRLLRQASR
jgi:hypothetical protein